MPSATGGRWQLYSLIFSGSPRVRLQLVLQIAETYIFCVHSLIEISTLSKKMRLRRFINSLLSLITLRAKKERKHSKGKKWSIKVFLLPSYSHGYPVRGECACAIEASKTYPTLYQFSKKHIRPYISCQKSRKSIPFKL